jgi:hypothetical protein
LPPQAQCRSTKMEADDSGTGSEEAPAACLFAAVAQNDYEGIVGVYAEYARNAVLSHIALRSQWRNPSMDVDTFRQGKWRCTIGSKGRNSPGGWSARLMR